MAGSGLRALWSRPQRGQRRASEQLQCGSYTVVWNRSARRTRSMALKLDRQGQLVAMTPMNTSRKEVRRFVLSRANWVDQRMQAYASLRERHETALGNEVRYLGRRLRIEAGVDTQHKVILGKDVLQVFSRRALGASGLHGRTNVWLREQANAILPRRLAVCSESSGIQHNGFQIKAYRARWGSCRHDGVIQLNWKLIQAPPEVIDYVIFHELCHRNYFNHSAAFWAEVERVCPEYRRYRAWLKEQGSLLLAD